MPLGRDSMARVYLLLLFVEIVCAQKKVCSCPKLMKPVCGVDGKTYTVSGRLLKPTFPKKMLADLNITFAFL